MISYINITTPDQIPQEPHWAILTYSSIYVPGDERSRSNPGHGYPASTVKTVHYATYGDEEGWKREIERYEKKGTPYSAMRVMPAIVSKQLLITIEPEKE